MRKYCLTREEAETAWEYERRGLSRAVVALKFYVSEKTLQRTYKYYKLGSPKRKQSEDKR